MRGLREPGRSSLRKREAGQAALADTQRACRGARRGRVNKQVSLPSYQTPVSFFPPDEKKQFRLGISEY